jgi:hypothetical protein
MAGSRSSCARDRPTTRRSAAAAPTSSSAPTDVDALFGVYYDGWRFGSVHVAPLLQVGAAWHGHDGGAEGHPFDSGYTRVFLAPGSRWTLARRGFTSVSHMQSISIVSGNQPVATNLFKLMVSVQF